MKTESQQLAELGDRARLDGGSSPYGGQEALVSTPRKRMTVGRIDEMRASGEKIAVLTAYDATFAAVADAAGVDCLLVGDSLGMVSQGRTSTVGVSLEEMVYHTQCVARGLERCAASSLLIADLPFGSYHGSTSQVMQSAVALMTAGAQMVKLEGGGWTTEMVEFLVRRGIPVCGHLGLTPQTVSALGGYRVQGRGDEASNRVRSEAKQLDDAGASMMVLEMIPHQLASQITGDMTRCATIGIGAGQGTAGQVLVMHDMLGVNLGKNPKFVRDFMSDAGSVRGAFAAYVGAVRDGSFPSNEVHAWA